MRKVVDERLRILGLERDHLREGAFVLRIIRIKALRDKFRVILIFRKDDRLAESIPRGYFQSIAHQQLEDFVDRVLVEQPAVERG